MRNLPAFGGSDFQRESQATCEIHIPVEKATKVNEIVYVDCFDGVGQLTVVGFCVFHRVRL